jgi:hypothetical protein
LSNFELVAIGLSLDSDELSDFWKYSVTPELDISNSGKDWSDGDVLLVSPAKVSLLGNRLVKPNKFDPARA